MAAPSTPDRQKALGMRVEPTGTCRLDRRRADVLKNDRSGGALACSNLAPDSR